MTRRRSESQRRCFCRVPGRPVGSGAPDSLSCRANSAATERGASPMGNGAAGSERLHPFEAVRIGGLETAVITRAALAELMVGGAIPARRKRVLEPTHLLFEFKVTGIPLTARAEKRPEEKE